MLSIFFIVNMFVFVNKSQNSQLLLLVFNCRNILDERGIVHKSFPIISDLADSGMNTKFLRSLIFQEDFVANVLIFKR